MNSETNQLDQNGIKTNQVLTITLLLSGFIFDIWPLVIIAAIGQLMGALALPFAPYRLFYQHIVRPSGIVPVNLQPDHAEPHRFAMLVASLFDFAGVLAILSGAPLVGWSLVWVVIALSNMNLWLSFCLGCWMYYQLNRLGLPGFTQSPIGEQQ